MAMLEGLGVLRMFPRLVGSECTGRILLKFSSMAETTQLAAEHLQISQVKSSNSEEAQGYATP